MCIYVYIAITIEIQTYRQTDRQIDRQTDRRRRRRRQKHRDVHTNNYQYIFVDVNNCQETEQRMAKIQPTIIVEPPWNGQGKQKLVCIPVKPLFFISLLYLNWPRLWSTCGLGFAFRVHDYLKNLGRRTPKLICPIHAYTYEGRSLDFATQS